MHFQDGAEGLSKTFVKAAFQKFKDVALGLATIMD
jgi:hypothetical protein